MSVLSKAVVITRQINETLAGKGIAQAVANASPHKFAGTKGNLVECIARPVATERQNTCHIIGFSTYGELTSPFDQPQDVSSGMGCSHPTQPEFPDAQLGNLGSAQVHSRVHPF